MSISGIDSPVFHCTVKNMLVVLRALVVVILLPKHEFVSLPGPLTSVDYIVDTTKVQPLIVTDQAAMTPATSKFPRRPVGALVL